MTSIESAQKSPHALTSTPSRPEDQIEYELEDYPCQIGTRVYVDERYLLQDQTYLEHTVAVFTLAMYTAWPYVLFILLLLSFIPSILVLNILLLSSLLLPCPLFSEWFLDLDVFRLWRQYFSFSYYMEEKLYPSNKYLFAEFPHGTFPMGPLLAATLIPKMFPGKKIYSLAASVLFKVPLYKQFMCLLGSQPAEKKYFNKMIQDSSVAIVVGGIAEIFMQDSTKERVLLSSRKGFVRLAVSNGVDVVPVFHFGNSRVMSIGPNSLISLCRKMRMSIGFLMGRWGLPIPRPHPLYMVIGRPVKVKAKISPGDPGFAEAVDDLHNRVVEELKRVYEKHKADFGWKDRPLAIE